MKWTTKHIALCAVLTALALGLSTLENLFPVSLVVPLPGVKLGLANIITEVMQTAKPTPILASIQSEQTQQLLPEGERRFFRCGICRSRCLFNGRCFDHKLNGLHIGVLFGHK